MEAAAFYQVAEKLVGPERIAVYKCVSDYLESICDEAEKVVEWLGTISTPLIEEWVAMNAALTGLTPVNAFPEDWNTWVQQTAATMTLTETQLNLLNNAAQRCWKRQSTPLSQLAEWVIPTRSKKERNEAFKDLLDALYQ